MKDGLDTDSKSLVDDALDRIRQICLSLPDANERTSHGEPAWFIRDKKLFAMFANHHHDDRVAVWCAAPLGAQEAMVAAEPAKYFRPPYVGTRGWIGVYLDRPVEWEVVADILSEAHRTVGAVKKARKPVP